MEGRSRLIDGFINSVVVYDDYILVTFNYKEGAERITFEQIERLDLLSLWGPKSRKIVWFYRFFLEFFDKTIQIVLTIYFYFSRGNEVW